MDAELSSEAAEGLHGPHRTMKSGRCFWAGTTIKFVGMVILFRRREGWASRRCSHVVIKGSTSWSNAATNLLGGTSA
jgi:hypothetical protein